MNNSKENFHARLLDSDLVPDSSVTPIWPTFDIAALLSDNGEQCGPAITYRRRQFAPMKLGHRQYVKDSRDNRLLPSDGEWQEGIALERVANVSDGAFTTVIAQRYRGDWGHWINHRTGKKCEPVVQILGFDSTIIKEPALPRGLSFAVINDVSGMTVAHSRKERVLTENFFHETDDDPILTSLVGRRLPTGEGGHGGVYRGKASTFTTRPVDDTNWTIVIIRNKAQFAQEALAELLVTIGLFSVPIVCLALIFLAGSFAWALHPFGWIFTNLKPLYKDPAAAVILVSAPLAIVFAAAADDAGVLLSIPVVPLIILALHRLSHQADTKSPFHTRSALLWHPWLYYAGATMAAGVMAWLGANTMLALTAWVILLLAVTISVRIREARLGFGTRGTGGAKTVGCGPQSQHPHSYMLALIYLILIVSVLPSWSAIKATSAHFSIIRSQADGVHAAIAIDRHWGAMQSAMERVFGHESEQEDAVQISDIVYVIQNAHPPENHPSGIYVLNKPAQGSFGAVQKAFEEKYGNGPAQKEMYPISSYFIEKLSAGSQLGNSLFHHGFKIHETLPNKNGACGKSQKGLKIGTWAKLNDNAICYRPLNQKGFPLEITPKAQTDSSATTSLAAGTLTLILAFGFLSLFARKVFGATLGKQLAANNRHFDAGKDDSQHHLLLSPSSEQWKLIRLAIEKKTANRASVTDLIQYIIRDKEEDMDSYKLRLSKSLLDKKRLYITNIDRVVSDPGLRRAALEALEDILNIYGGWLTIVADQQILFRIVRPDAYGEALEENDYPGNIECKRWSGIFARFIKQYSELPYSADMYEKPWRTNGILEHVWERETRLIPPGHPIRTVLGTEPVCDPIHGISWNIVQNLETIEFHAGSYYQQLWAQCTFREKVLLHSLSLGRLTNTQDNGALEHLRRRGVVVLEPLPQIASASFASFVRNAERPEVFAQWEAKLSQDMWSILRIPLIILILLFVMFLFNNAEQEIEGTVAMLTGVITAVPLILRIFSTFRGGTVE